MDHKVETANHPSTHEAQLRQLIDESSTIRSEMLALEETVLAEQFDFHESHVESAKNFLR